jgi:hypothetical protein
MNKSFISTTLKSSKSGLKMISIKNYKKPTETLKRKNAASSKSIKRNPLKSNSLITKTSNSTSPKNFPPTHLLSTLFQTLTTTSSKLNPLYLPKPVLKNEATNSKQASTAKMKEPNSCPGKAAYSAKKVAVLWPSPGTRHLTQGNLRKTLRNLM